MFKKFCLLTCLFILSMASLFSQPIIKAEIDASEYCAGDLVKMRVNIENNPGLHSLFFYLEYDGGVLSFEDIRNGSVVHNALDTGELLYADNSTQSGFLTTKVVVSFSLNGPDVVTENDGCVVELLFRVIGSGTGTYGFHFLDNYILDGNNTQVVGATWQDSDEFTIISPYAGEFILIKRPYVNEVIDSDQADVGLICSQGDYLVKVKNIAGSYDTGYISVQDGRLFDISAPLVPDINIIVAELYSPDPNPGGEEHIFLTDHSVRVYRGNVTDEITIVSPQNHALVNTDTVIVQVESSLPNVYINGETATENSGIYSKRIHLKNGFNTIIVTGHKNEPDNILYESVAEYGTVEYLQDNTASWTTNEFIGKYLEIDGKYATIFCNSDVVLALDPATNEIGPIGGGGGLGTPYRIRSSRETDAITNINYTDSIQVFYQKDTSLFRIIRPEENQGFKPGEYSLLTIQGEIDSLYKPLDDPYTQVYEENTVTLEVVHYPYNTLLPSQSLYNEDAIVTEAEPDYEMSGSNYIFYNDDEISLQGLSDGEIEITAYKNKEGDTWDDKISRYVYVDNQRLWINLVQPNVYTSDLLDSVEQIEEFNGGPITNILPEGDVIATEQGEIRLQAEDPVIEEQNVSGFAAITKTPDGTLYGLKNTSTSMLRK